MSDRALSPAPLLAILAVFCSGCGSIADPRPPSLNIPETVTDLSARQVGDKLVVQFTIPELTTDGVLMRRIGGVDLRGGPGTGAAFDLAKWAEQARKEQPEIEKAGPARLQISVAGWEGRDIVLGVRVAGPKGKFSGWSNLVAIPVVAALEPPAGVRAEAVREGVKLDWQMPSPRPGLSFRVYRRAPDQKQAVLVKSVEKPPYIDPDTQYGKEYAYSVQAVQKAGQTEAESEVSQTVSIAPKDVFAPSVPAGLAAVAGTGSVQLNWEPDPEPDLAGYRVYRSVDGGPFERVAEAATPNYGDRAVQPGKKYAYRVSAFDQNGNESSQSAPVEAAVQ